jgi:hypothetical protein
MPEIEDVWDDEEDMAMHSGLVASIAPCDYPGLQSNGMCCGDSPCSVEWIWPCESTGGCPDRSTCNGAYGCSEPVFKNDASRAASTASN